MQARLRSKIAEADRFVKAPLAVLEKLNDRDGISSDRGGNKRGKSEGDSSPAAPPGTMQKQPMMTCGHQLRIRSAPVERNVRA